MPSFTHVIFDLDGTLLNTLEDLAAAANHVCAAHGWPAFSVDEYRHKVGNGMRKLTERFLPAELARDPEAVDGALDELLAYYARHKEDHTAPYAGVPEMIDELRGAGLTLAVLTNKEHTAAAPLVARYFGESAFALVQGRVDAFPPKPAAPITQHVLAQLGADPERTLYVGDSDVDVQCGHNAGLLVAGAVWGFRGRAELEREGADYLAERPEDVARIVQADA